jgi:exoribonuclease-2
LNDHDARRKADRPATPALAAIAHEVMLQRGLQPDFSPAVHAELARIDGPAKKSGADIRDLRQLLWCSIDNDDSRDLDQLTVARENGGDANKFVEAKTTATLRSRRRRTNAAWNSCCPCGSSWAVGPSKTRTRGSRVQ